MTICIGALADGGQACIVAADREITVGVPMNIAFEHHERKIETITKASVILTAGNALVAAETVARSRRAIVALGGDEDAQRAATVVRDMYMAVHLERAEHVILRPRGLTLQEFKDFGTQKIPFPIYQQIDQLFFNFTLNTEFLIAGVDGSGGHLSWVHYHGVQGGGWLDSFDKLGYQAIGSGGSHAAILLSLTGQHRDLTVAQTLYNVYQAKVNAEVAPGVGNATDIAVITKDGVEFMTAPFIEKMGAFRKKLTDQKPDLGDLEGLLKGRKEK